MIMRILCRIAIVLVSLWCQPILLVAADATSASAPTPAIPVTAAGESAATAPHKPDPTEEKFWQALKLLRSTKPADLAAGRTALQAASDLEFTHAQVLLGNCLIAGSYGFSKDVRKGAGLFRLAAEHGNAFAQVSLGQCFFTGTGMHKDLPQAEHWLTAALSPGASFTRPVPPPDFFSNGPDGKGGDDSGAIAGELQHDPASETQATAHFFLGQIRTEQKNLGEAQAHFVAAATAGPGGRDGVSQAALQAALNFAFGNGVSRDSEKARDMLEQSRKLAGRMSVGLIHNYVALKIVDDFATADLEESATKAGEVFESELQIKIATTFANKKSKDYNLAEAVKWYELAAQGGKAWAMLNLGLIYSSGSLGSSDPAKAFEWFQKAGGGEIPKDILSAANLAICYKQGLGTSKDPEKAAALFKKYRDQQFLCYLGTIGQEPALPQTFEQNIILLETWANDKADAQARYFMGRRYLGGWDVPRNLEKAVKWFKLATKGNQAAAYCELGILYENFPGVVSDFSHSAAEAVGFYKKGGELGDADAMVNYALMLSIGRGIERDLTMAESWDLRCLQLVPDHVRAHNNLAVLYDEHLRAAIDRKDAGAAGDFRRKMLQHLNAAAQLKYGVANQNLGFLYYRGKLVDQDYRLAYGYFEQATEFGVLGIHAILGRMHELGQGVPVTFTEAAYHYRLAALEGDMDALRHLVDFYVEGKGVSQDLDRAMFWISFLAQKSSIYTLTRLGDRFMREGKYEIAQRLFEILSTAEDPKLRGLAHQRLGVLYTNGWGVGKDLEQAKKHRKLAVADGNLPALHDTAMALLAEGKKDDAIDMLQDAAKHGLVGAQYQLGLMYLNGDGVPKNLKKAVKLLGEAADRGSPAAEVAFAGLTLDKIPGAPDLEHAIKFAEAAAAEGQSNAKELVEQLKRLRKL